MEKLPISIGILSWHSGQVLVDTLTTYYENGLFDMVNDVTILFQEFNEQDYQIAKHFGLNIIGMQTNIGIGKAFIKLTESVLAALRDTKYDALLAKSAIDMDHIAHHYTGLLRNIIQNPHHPDTYHTVTDFIKHERDLKMLYLMM